MVDPASHPLTTDEAKARLRLAADRASPSALVERHPWQALAAALIGGYAAGQGDSGSALLRSRATQLLWLLASEGFIASVRSPSHVHRRDK